MADNKRPVCTDRRVVSTIGRFSPYILIFVCAAQPGWSVLQSDCVIADQPKKVFSEGHIIMWSNCPKPYKASSNALKAIVELTK